MSHTAVAFTEMPVFEVPLPWSPASSSQVQLAQRGQPYTRAYEETARRLGAQELFVVQETESRLIPSRSALREALAIVQATSARWFICAHESTLATTPSELEHVTRLVSHTGADLVFVVAQDAVGAAHRPQADFAVRLTEHMEWANWTPPVLASVMGTSVSTVLAYLAGHREPVPAELRSAAGNLGLSETWLAGEEPYPKWGEAVRRLRQAIRQYAPRIHPGTLDARIRQVMHFLRTDSPLCRQDWFFAGILGVPPLHYRRFLLGACEADPLMRERFCDVFDVSTRWLAGVALTDSPDPESIILHIPL